VSETQKTLNSLGKRFAVSRERIRQIYEAALALLRDSFGETPALNLPNKS
jgi:DNA-directed RNA polymerase sigma subunit (sigma70/sigma32)